MQFEIAAADSSLGIAWRNHEEGRMEVYDMESHGFFYHDYNPKDRTEEKAYTIIRRPGRGSVKKDDWLPCATFYMQKLIEEFKAKQEGRDVTIKSPWEAAVEVSLVKRAVRQTVDMREMIRDEHRNTWQVVPGDVLTRVTGPFKKFDGWEPMGEDHRLANIDLDVQGPIYLRAKERKEKNYKNPDAAPAVVLPETIAACQEMARTLKDSLGLVQSPELQQEIVREMLQLSKALGWHLREDRHRY